MQPIQIGEKRRVQLPVLGQAKAQPQLDAEPQLDIDAELQKFEAEQRKSLGLDGEKRHWVDHNPRRFTAEQRVHTTLLVGGLTMAHDFLITGALSGIGYKVQTLDVPDTSALQFGKEFGNRGQCNPTYFTVGNLIKHLTHLRDVEKIPTQDIIANYLFVTAGACGPCRFGTYVTEYRKALRDSGFEGFRVLLFQQQGGLKQATGGGEGLELNPKFFVSVVLAIVVALVRRFRYRRRFDHDPRPSPR